MFFVIFFFVLFLNVTLVTLDRLQMAHSKANPRRNYTAIILEEEKETSVWAAAAAEKVAV